MIKKRHLRLLAALTVVFYVLTATHLTSIALASGYPAEPQGAVEGGQAGETPGTPEEPEEPQEPEEPGEPQEPEEPEDPGQGSGQQPGEQPPGEESGDDPDDSEGQPGEDPDGSEGEPGNPDEELVDEPGDPDEDPAGEAGELDDQGNNPDGPSEESEDEPGEDEGEGESEPGTPAPTPTTTKLIVRHIVARPDGEFVTVGETEVEGLEVGTTVYGADFVAVSEHVAFLYSEPEELVLGEEGNFIELFYEVLPKTDRPEAPVSAPAPELFFPGYGLMGKAGASGIQSAGGEPGSLILDKRADAVGPGLWKITLTLEGIDAAITSDVVLVIDTSNSMSNRLENAKTKAKELVAALLERPNTRVALVSFSDGVTVHFSDFLEDKESLEDAIDALTAGGGTFTQAAIRQARLLLQASKADKKTIILFSDGEPTYSYGFNEKNNNNYKEVESGWLYTAYYSRDDLAESAFNYDRKFGNGSGSVTLVRTESELLWLLPPVFWDYYYYAHHGNSAVAEARIAKNDYGLTIYSVDFGPGNNQGSQILKNIASASDKYYRWNSLDESQLCQQIGGESLPAATGAVVTDPIATEFSLVPGSIVAEADTTYQLQGQKIIWNVGTISEERGKLILTYIVEINDGVWSNKYYPTNGETYVEYTGADGHPQKDYFNVPKVRVLIGPLTVYYYRVNSSGQPIDAEGNPVDSPEELYSYTYINEGVSLQLPYEYSVYFNEDDDTATTIEIGENVYRYHVAGAKNPAEGVLTPAAPSDDIWFACVAVAPVDLEVTGYHGVYDGKPHSVHVSGVLEDDTLEYSIDGENWVSEKPYFVDAGEYTVVVRATHPVYETRTATAAVKIYPRKVTVKALDSWKYYDDPDPLPFTYEIVKGSLVWGDCFQGELERESGEDPGTYAITRGTLTLGKNYDLKVLPGTFTIRKRVAEVPLVIHNYTGVYDGNPHSITVDPESLLEGDTVYYRLSEEDEWSQDEQLFTYVTEGSVTVFVLVTNKYYEDREGTGTVEITKRPLELTAGSASKFYDGEPLTSNEWSHTGGELAQGDWLDEVTVEGSQTDVGSSKNVITNVVIKRYDDNNEPIVVTENYHITRVDGWLTVRAPNVPPPPPPTPEEPEEIEEEIPDEPPPLLNLADHFAYIQGYPDGTVRPEGYITREEVAAVFFRLLDPEYRELIRAYEAPFPDVAPDRWSAKHIATLAQGGILTGYPDGTFGPENYITRAELAVIASRFDELTPLDEDRFSDVKGHWAEQYINSAAAKGWVEGYPDGTFQPDNYITRAEFVTLVNRILNRKVRAENILPEAKQFPDLLPDSWYYEAMQEAVNSHLYEREEDDYEKWLEIYEPDIEM